MALIVEDGTGKTDADAYISQADVSTYWTNRPTNALAATWAAASSANKDSAIRVATAYLDASYRWKGLIATDNQALGWPRECVRNERGATLDGQVPARVKQATAELAARALTEDLSPDTDASDFVESEKVGPLEVKYKSSSPSKTQYSYISNLLRDLGWFSSGTTVMLSRA